MAGAGVVMLLASFMCLEMGPRLQRSQVSKAHVASAGSEGSGHSGSG